MARFRSSSLTVSTTINDRQESAISTEVHLPGSTPWALQAEDFRISRNAPDRDITLFIAGCVALHLTIRELSNGTRRIFVEFRSGSQIDEGHGGNGLIA